MGIWKLVGEVGNDLVDSGHSHWNVFSRHLRISDELVTSEKLKNYVGSNLQCFDFFSSSHAAWLHRKVLAVLANVVGDTWNGQQVPIKATGTVQDDGVVGVTLSPYQPQRFRNMTMTMAVLLSDSNFQTSWIAVDNKVDQASGIFNSQCSENAFLGARFQICGNDWGWGAQISQVYLEPWRPGERGVFFQIHDKDDQERSHQTKVHEVKMQFENGSSPVSWAIPKDPKERCEFPTVSAEGLPDCQDFHMAGEKAMAALGTSPPALCEFISRGCLNVTMVRPNQSTARGFENILSTAFVATIKSAASLVDHFSSGIAPVLRCFRQDDRNVPWAWGQDSSWQIAADPRMVHVWGRVNADVLWIEGIDIGMALPLKVEDLLKIVSPNASKVDEGLVRDACSFLLSESNLEIRPAIMETLAGTAFKTNNPMAVRLVGKECFNYSQSSESQGAKKVVSLAWDSAKANSNGLQILNETLRWENADFVKSMLEFATSDQCAGCADLLQELIRVTGSSWSPLVFKTFRPVVGQNSVAFLRINATVPWICVDELEVYYYPKMGAPLVFGLQNFLQQLNMCAAPISALDIETPLTVEGLGQLIGLETKLPKSLALKLDFDGVPMFLKKLPLLPQLENLETLKLSLDNMDDAQTSTFCNKVMKQPSIKLKDITFRGGFGRQIHAQGMIAISKMVAALPELERLDVSYNHIGDAGFKTFSEAMAPVASKSKLRFIDVAEQHDNLGNVGVQALGKTLALLPALEGVVIESDENITDESVVGLLFPFLNKSLCSLRKIHLGGTKVSDAGVTVLAQLMEKHPLEDISIGHTMITDEGLRLLGHALQNSTCLLKKVYAYQRREENKAWSDEGVRDLLQGLQHCPNLVQVDVGGPKLSNQTIQMALKELSGWQNLTMLDVTYGDDTYNLKQKNPLL